MPDRLPKTRPSKITRRLLKAQELGRDPGRAGRFVGTVQGKPSRWIWLLTQASAWLPGSSTWLWPSLELASGPVELGAVRVELEGVRSISIERLPTL